MSDNKGFIVGALIIAFVVIGVFSAKANTLSYDTSELLTRKEWNEWKQNFHPKEYINKKLEERIDIHWQRFINATRSEVK